MEEPPRESPEESPTNSTYEPPEQPKEHILRGGIRIFATVLGIFGLGLKLAEKYPVAGAILMLVAIFYGSFELFISASLTRLPLWTRISLISILSTAFLLMSWSDRQELFPSLFPNKQETWDKLTADAPAESGVHFPISDAVFTITNGGHAALGEYTITCQVRALSVLGGVGINPMFFPNMIVAHGSGLNGGGDAVSVNYCFDVVKQSIKTSVLMTTCADVVLGINYLFRGDTEQANKSFRFVATGRPENGLLWRKIASKSGSDYCGTQGRIEQE